MSRHRFFDLLEAVFWDCLALAPWAFIGVLLAYRG